MYKLTKAEQAQAEQKIGVTGKLHKSEAEARASYILRPHGWIPYETKFPVEFVDSEGTTFNACPDFYHPATGFYAEFKTKRMNGVGEKKQADGYMAQFEQDLLSGAKWATKGKKTNYQLDHAWNHSIQKIAAVSNQLPSSTPLVVFYEKDHGLNEERRCARNGVFMLSLENMGAFQLFLKLASFGNVVAFSRNNSAYTGNGCIPFSR